MSSDWHNKDIEAICAREAKTEARLRRAEKALRTVRERVAKARSFIGKDLARTNPPKWEFEAEQELMGALSILEEWR